MFKKLFGEAGVKNAVTLFHKPSSPASTRILQLLKQSSSSNSDSSTSSSSSADSNSSGSGSVQKKAYTLEVSEQAPTSDQLRSILEFVGQGKTESVVEGADNVDDAQRKVRLDVSSLRRPLMVDWNAGKVISGEDEAAVKAFIDSQKPS